MHEMKEIFVFTNSRDKLVVNETAQSLKALMRSRLFTVTPPHDVYKSSKLTASWYIDSKFSLTWRSQPWTSRASCLAVSCCSSNLTFSASKKASCVPSAAIPVACLNFWALLVNVLLIPCLQERKKQMNKTRKGNSIPKSNFWSNLHHLEIIKSGKWRWCMVSPWDGIQHSAGGDDARKQTYANVCAPTITNNFLHNIFSALDLIDAIRHVLDFLACAFQIFKIWMRWQRQGSDLLIFLNQWFWINITLSSLSIQKGAIYDWLTWSNKGYFNTRWTGLMSILPKSQLVVRSWICCWHACKTRLDKIGWRAMLYKSS